MRTIHINDILDSDDIPQNVLDYALYSHISHLNVGLPSGRNMSMEYDRMPDRFEERREVLKAFRRLGIKP